MIRMRNRKTSRIRKDLHLWNQRWLVNYQSCLHSTTRVRVYRGHEVEGIMMNSDDSESESEEDSDEVPDVAALVMERLTEPRCDIDFLEQAEFGLSVVDLERYRRMDPDKVPPSVYRDLFTAPELFEHAWNHEDEWQRKKWREAIIKELYKMESLRVWKKIKWMDIPKGRRCVKHKWIFEIKRNGVFRARLVACGYSQIPGVDFTESHSPVINDVTVRIILILLILRKYKSMIVDVETAFLHGILGKGEEIYMDCPKGMIHSEDECLLLEKTIYGLVQSARAYYKKFTEVMKKEGFTQSAADPCLYVRRDAKGVVYIAMYVDDCLCVGDEEALKDAVEGIGKYFKLKIEESMSDYLSCEILFNKDRTKAWIGQPHMIKKIEDTFGEMVKKKQNYKTPGTPHHRTTKPTEETGKLTDEEQKLYRTGVGMLLYLVKYSRPDISNAVRELSKGMKEATPDAMKELMRVIKFVLSTKNLGLKMQPKPVIDKWQVVVYSDSDWGGDPETRGSVTGIAVFVNGCIVSWVSKAQKAVSLSSSEAEWYALSEAAKEVKFIAQILLTMDIPVQIPIVVRVDNVGAIFMSESHSTKSKTKHIDIRHNFVRQYVDEGFLKIIFVKSEDNLSDGFTKNTNIEVYEKHHGEFVADRDYINNDDRNCYDRKGVGGILTSSDDVSNDAK